MGLRSRFGSPGAPIQMRLVYVHWGRTKTSTLWKDVDLDIPILKQAKAEYAKLQ
jgi:hypothetical protein